MYHSHSWLCSSIAINIPKPRHPALFGVTGIDFVCRANAARAAPWERQSPDWRRCLCAVSVSAYVAAAAFTAGHLAVPHGLVYRICAEIIP